MNCFDAVLVENGYRIDRESAFEGLFARRKRVKASVLI